MRRRRASACPRRRLRRARRRAPAPTDEVDELDRPQRDVGPLEQPVEREPVRQWPNGALGRAEEAGRGLRAARAPACASARRLAEVRREPPLEPRRRGRASARRCRARSTSEADEQRRSAACRRSARRRRSGRRPDGRSAPAASRPPGIASCADARRAAGTERVELELLAGARGGQVLDAPGAPELRRRSPA